MGCVVHTSARFSVPCHTPASQSNELGRDTNVGAQVRRARSDDANASLLFQVWDTAVFRIACIGAEIAGAWRLARSKLQW